MTSARGASHLVSKSVILTITAVRIQQTDLHVDFAKRNTIYMQAIIEQLRNEGYQITDNDLKHLGPARFEHINPYGHYTYKAQYQRSCHQVPVEDIPAYHFQEVW